MALLTVLCVAFVAVFTRGMLQRLPILIGLVLAYVLYALLTNGAGLGKPVDWSGVAQAAWIGLPWAYLTRDIRFLYWMCMNVA